MHIEMYISEAIEIISAWDIPDEEFAQSVNDQAKLMAGVHPDDSWETIQDCH